MKTQYPGFKLMHLCKYKFKNGLTKLQMKMDNFYLPQRGSEN